MITTTTVTPLINCIIPDNHLPICLNHTEEATNALQVDEVLPFVESCLAPSLFNPIISQMHWKRGDKLVDVVQDAEDKEDAQEL